MHGGLRHSFFVEVPSMSNSTISFHLDERAKVALSDLGSASGRSTSETIVRILTECIRDGRKNVAEKLIETKEEMDVWNSVLQKAARNSGGDVSVNDFRIEDEHFAVFRFVLSHSSNSDFLKLSDATRWMAVLAANVDRYSEALAAIDAYIAATNIYSEIDTCPLPDEDDEAGPLLRAIAPG